MVLPGGSGDIFADGQTATMDKDQLRAARRDARLTIEQVSAEIDLSVSQISRIERGEREPRQKDVDAMFALYKKTKSHIQLEVEQKRPPAREVSASFLLPPDSDSDMPIFGSAHGGPDGAIIFEANPIEWVKTPDNLRGVKDCYGVYVQGESMMERLYPGDRLNIHPNKPAIAGKLVVVQLKPEVDGGPFEVYVKRFKRWTNSHLIVSQLNPPKDIEYPRERVQAVHLVVGIIPA